MIGRPKQPDGAGPRKRVLLVEDHPILRLGLAMLINQKDDLQPDVAVVDWSLKDKNPSDVTATLRQQHPQMPVLVRSSHEELAYGERALRAGASGYIMIREAAEKLVKAIRHVAAGHTYLSCAARPRCSKPPHAGLPKRIATHAKPRPRDRGVL
jgi:DNA-binding NarL/FixJ family response regulator